VAVKTSFVILHLDSYLDDMLQLLVKVHEVRIDVIQDRSLWSQAERRGKSAAERLNVPPAGCDCQSAAICGTSQRFPPAHFKGGANKESIEASDFVAETLALARARSSVSKTVLGFHVWRWQYNSSVRWSSVDLIG